MKTTRKIKAAGLLRKLSGQEFPEGKLFDLMWEEISRVRASIPEKTDLTPVLEAHRRLTDAVTNLSSESLSKRDMEQINVELSYLRSKLQESDTFMTKKEWQTFRDRFLGLMGAGGNANRNIQVGSVNVLRPYTDINLIAGADVTITSVPNQQTKYTDITIGTSGSGGGIGVETPVGTIDGSNTTFTVSNTPVFVVADASHRVEGQGFAYSVPTIEFDPLIPPVQWIRSYYST